MTPGQFEFTYGPEALVLARRMGLAYDLFLVQWAVETGWGAEVVGNNLANIECGPGVFCRYGALSQFCDAEETVLRQPNMALLLSAGVHEDLTQQFVLLGAIPWDAGHYNNGGGPGSQLLTYWEELRMPTLTEIMTAVSEMKGKVDSLYAEYLTRGFPVPPDLPNTVPPSTVLDWITADHETLKNLPAAGGGGLTPDESSKLTEIHDRVVRDLA